MFEKLKNRFGREPDEVDQMMRRISKRAGGGAIMLIDTDISLDSVRSNETPAQHTRTLTEFREGELLLNETRRLESDS